MRIYVKVVRGAAVLIPLICMIFSSCAINLMNEPGKLVSKTVEEDPSIPYLDVNGTRLHVETFGNPANPKLVMLHGGPGGDFAYMTRMKPLSDSFFLIFFDQRGSGLSRRHPAKDFTVKALIDDLDAIIDHFGGRAFLLGHSWGGQYATMYISAHPEKTAGAVLIDPGPFTGPDFSRWFIPYLVPNTFSPGTHLTLWADDLISPDDHERYDYSLMMGKINSDVGTGYNTSTTDITPVYRLGAVAQKAVIASGTDSSGKYVWDFTTGLSRFTTQVLFIRGELNEIHSREYLEHAMKYYTAPLPLVTIAGVGHDQIWVRADETIAEVRNYLSRFR